jgi:murein DD-endopeptidase MepM/ murein hydrolase activator NlpD
MPFEILSKPLKCLSGDIRLGARLLARRWKQLDRATRSRIELGMVFSLLPLSAALAALAAAPVALELDSLQSQPLVEAIDAPAIDDQLHALADRAEVYLREARVQRGEPFGTLMQRLGVDDEPALRFLRTDPAAKEFVRIGPGRFVQAQIEASGRLRWLRAFSGGDETAANAITRVLTLQRDEASAAGFSVRDTSVAMERRIELRSGEIEASLFAAADAADIPDSIAQRMIDALESEIDFHRNLRRGDSFRVIYEGLYVGGEYLRPGRLLAVEFVNQGKSVEAFWYDDGSKHGGYYAFGGRNMKRTFLRSPLEYTRLSSGFSDSRSHPLFGYDAAHRGIDYSASSGTNVRSVAAGVVQFAGWQRGYGNVVEVRHNDRHSTLYAHLQSFGAGVVNGARVAQGDVVGQVGSTGWATGPHLHFEVKIRGNQVNPLTAELPAAEPLAEPQRDAFIAAATPLREKLALLERIRIASNGT